MLLGLYSIYDFKRGFLIGSFFALTLPLSGYYTSLHYLNGVMVFDGYIIGIFFYFFKDGTIRIYNSEIFLIVLFVSYLIGSYFFSSSNVIWVLKDIRPLFYILSILVIENVVLSNNFYICLSEINFLAISSALSNIVWLLLGIFGLMPMDSSDLFIENNIYRYFDLSTYFSIYNIFFIYYLLINNEVKFKEIQFSFFMSFVSILISNSRMILFAVIICLGIISIKNFYQFKKYIVISIFLVLFFLLGSDFINQQRVLQSLSYEGLAVQLLNRFSPAVIAFKEMDAFNFIFGMGLGFFFEIPWFGYRNMDSFNASLDSAYLTHYIKQGFFGIYVIIIFINRLSSTVNNSILFFALCVFWFLICFTVAPLYQNIVYGGIIYQVLIFRIKLTDRSLT